MISLAVLGRGSAAAAYYLRQQAGCAADYYLGHGEQRGRWLGPGADALALIGEFDAGREEAFRRLLDGCGPDGTRLVPPVLRSDPRSHLPAGPLLTALQRAAASRGVEVTALLGDPALVEAYGRLARTQEARRQATVEVRLPGRLAAAAGLDPCEVYRGRDGADRYAAALAHAGERVDVRRAGYDVVVSAPKSVSVLYALGPPAVAEAVRAAHESAVEQAQDYLQRHAGHGLRGHQGDGARAERVVTDGLLVAAFGHRTSRADDPQLHTHLVVPNVLRGADGRWSAVDSRALHRHALTAGYLYQAVLRGGLTAELGVGWTEVRKGVAEVAGVPEPLLRAFSTRRGQIDTELARTGGEGRAAAQRACYATRPVKSGTAEATLRERWAARARAAGADPARLAETVCQRAAAPHWPGRGETAAVLFGPAGLTATQTSFDRRDALQALAATLPTGLAVTAAELEGAVDDLLARPAAVPLLDGADPDSGRRYSTGDLIAVEQRALAAAGLRTQVEPVSGEELRSVLDGRRLSPEQQAMVATLLTSTRTVEVVVGPAGSGKTAALAAAADGWRQGDVPVLGTALAAIAARRLESGTGIPATTLHRLLRDCERPGAALPAGAVVVVDEAAMVGTRQLAALLGHVSDAGGKLVLVGDPRQLPEIDAGGLFAAVARRQPITLSGNQRQAEPWERAALHALRDGRVGPALDAYLTHHRVHVAADTDGVRERISRDYLAARAAARSPYDVVVLAARRGDAAALNDRIRADLRAAGLLDTDGVSVPGAGGCRDYAEGDLVTVTRNDHRRGLLNGTRATLTGVAGGQLMLHTYDDRTVAVPASWAGGHLDHGYALTVHKAQGLTVDTALLDGTTALCQQAGYTGLSRGRVANHLYTTLTRPEPAAHHRLRLVGADPADVVAGLVDRLRPRLAQRLASEQRPVRQLEDSQLAAAARLGVRAGQNADLMPPPPGARRPVGRRGMR